MAELLLVYLPLLISFLAFWQLSELLVARLVVQRAVSAAARAAAVVLPDDPSFYNSEAEHTFLGQRRRDVELAAGLVLGTSPGFSSQFTLQVTPTPTPREFAEKRVNLEAEFRCRALPLLCGTSGTWTFQRETDFAYHGASYRYELSISDPSLTQCGAMPGPPRTGGGAPNEATPGDGTRGLGCFGAHCGKRDDNSDEERPSPPPRPRDKNCPPPQQCHCLYMDSIRTTDPPFPPFDPGDETAWRRDHPPGDFQPRPGVTMPPFPRPKPDPNILSGHGNWILCSYKARQDNPGRYIPPEDMRIPAGTWIEFPKAVDGIIFPRETRLIETWHNGKPYKVYEPGHFIPNYTLFPLRKESHWNELSGHPTTVTRPTELRTLLRPNMGLVRWAACQKLTRIDVCELPGGDRWYQDPERYAHCRCSDRASSSGSRPPRGHPLPRPPQAPAPTGYPLPGPPPTGYPLPAPP